MDFEWDPAKVDSNLAKHGVSFVAAMLVFDDARRLIAIDPGSHGELRFRTIGEARGELLFVAYTFRATARRIITARRANRRERASYSLPAGH